MESPMAADLVEQNLQADIGAAKARLVELAAERESWTAFELKEHARNGWSSATMGLALYALLDEGRLVRDADQRVRVA
jgi:hypothetical protein